MSKEKQDQPGPYVCDRYAVAVWDTLSQEFPALRQDMLAGLVHKMVYNNALTLCGIELIVDDPISANWRLTPAAHDRRRVRIGCWRVSPSPEDAERERRLNAALDALRM
jgi:hypothetical protein